MNWIWTVSRNARIEAELRGALKSHGVNFGEKFGVTVTNPTAASVIVREVALRDPKWGRVILNFAPDRGLVKRAPVTVEEQARAERRHVVLPPKTEGRWQLTVIASMSTCRGVRSGWSTRLRSATRMSSTSSVPQMAAWIRDGVKYHGDDVVAEIAKSKEARRAEGGSLFRAETPAGGDSPPDGK